VPLATERRGGLVDLLVALRRVAGAHVDAGADLVELELVGLGAFVPWVASYVLQPDPATSVGDVVLVSLLVMPILIYAIISATTRVSECSQLNT
jgi:hypothetical protein